MKRDRPGEASLQLTEWMWFEAQLTLAGLKASKVGPHEVIYTFDLQAPAPVKCWIGLHPPDEGAHRYRPPETSDDAMPVWVSSLVEQRRGEIRNVLRQLPGLSSEIDFAKHVVVNIEYHSDFGSDPVCRVEGDDIQWHGG